MAKSKKKDGGGWVAYTVAKCICTWLDENRKEARQFEQDLADQRDQFNHAIATEQAA